MHSVPLARTFLKALAFLLVAQVVLVTAAPVNLRFPSGQPNAAKTAETQKAVDAHAQNGYPSMDRFDVKNTMHIQPDTGDLRPHITGKGYEASGKRIPYVAADGQQYRQHHVEAAPDQTVTQGKGQNKATYHSTMQGILPGPDA